MMLPLTDRTGHKLTTQTLIPKVLNRLCNYYLDFKVSFLWILGYLPFHLIRKFIFILSGVGIGPYSTIHIGARFYQPKNISIGNGTVIGDHATLDGRANLTIGNHVAIASQVMIFNSQHDINHPDFVPLNAPVNIEDYVFIGPRAIILPGVTIGRGAVVAAGAVVTKDVPPKAIVAGVPAKVIGQRKLDKLDYKLGRFRLFQ